MEAQNNSRSQDFQQQKQFKMLLNNRITGATELGKKQYLP